MRKLRGTALLALAIGIVATAVAAPAARSQASQIESIAPTSGRAGDRVTIRGRGFGSHNVQVVVNGAAADIVSASGHEVVFVLPGGTPAGMVPVVATNPGGRTGAVQFRVLEGVLLKGPQGASVADALTDLGYTPASPADVDADGVILTRIDVRLTPEATVGQLNAALTGVSGGIVAMQPGVLTVVVAVPRQPTPADLQRQADLLAAYPGIRLASAGRQPAAAVLPFAATDPVPNVSELQKVQVLHHLLPSRFPAAWNAAGANQRLLDGCPRIPVIVLDFFGHASNDWLSEFPAFAPGGLAGDGSSDTHGFDSSTTLAARFDAGALTGANPFQQCLQLRPVSVRGSSFEAISLQLSAQLRLLPAGKAVVNQSIGYQDDCPTCVPTDIPARVRSGLQRAHETMTWKEATAGRWNDFAIAVSAGNDANKPLAEIYDALGRARYSSPASISTTADPLLAFAGQGVLFVPPADRPEFPSLAASADELMTLASDVRARGLDLLPPAFNTIMVGSTQEGLDGATLTRSAFSDFFPDLHAVGECVPMSLDPFRCSNGTSFAAPQVAGLLSYLWLLSPELRNDRSSSEAVRAIQENVRTTAAGLPVLDAYAAVLSLDAAGAPAPATASIRVALLDADGNGSFTDDDLDTFLSHYFDINGLPLVPTEREYSQFDLNGDGFTGGPEVDRFDLDRTGSTQFGRSLYTALEYDIAGERVSLNENNVTDLQILCYYAYSPLYLGAAQRRETLLANRCGEITVAVDPAGLTLAPGGTQQFAATVRGTTDPRVTWVVPGGGGTVSSTGFFTAGTAPGTYTVRAISVIDPNAFGEGTVTITGGVKSNVFIGIGGANVPAGHITAAVAATGFQLTRPLGEKSFVLSELTRALSGISIGVLTIHVMEPVAFTYATGNVSRLNLAAGCGASLDVTAADIRRDPVSPGLFGNGEAGLVVCESNTRVRLGDVEFIDINNSRSSTIDVSTRSVALGVFITSNSVSRITLTGSLPGILVNSNFDISLSAARLEGNAAIQGNNLPNGLESLGIGTISGNLLMRFNQGFTDQEGLTWAGTRVGGTITVTGNNR